MDISPVPALDRDLIDRLGSDLRASGWTVDAMDDTLSARARAALMRDQRVPALVELAGRDDVPSLLTRLFVLGSTEDAAAVDAALPTIGVSGLVRLGLLVPSTPIAEGAAHDESADDPDAPTERPVPTGTVTAAFDLRPHAAELPDPDSPGASLTHEWWVVSDLGEATTGRPLHPDHVLGIGGATASLLRLTRRERVGRALDIGTGCGIQALYLATHADTVVATDLSARACAITSFNAALNGVSVDVRQGSLYDPVDGERFDLIVSNPPFVITPDSVRAEGLLEYRDGGMERDNLIAAVIGGLPSHLEVGGSAQMLANWEIPADVAPQEWGARVRRWTRGLPLDTWAVQRDVLDPAEYVEMWMRDSGGVLVGRDRWESTYRAWLADFDRAGVGSIGMGMLAFTRRPDGESGRTVLTELPDGGQPTGEDVSRVLSLMGLEDAPWESVVVRAEDVREERHLVPGSTDPQVLVLHQGTPLGHSVRVGSATAGIVGACDGEFTLGQLAAGVAAVTDRPVEEVRAETGPALLELLRVGMLRPVTPTRRAVTGEE